MTALAFVAVAAAADAIECRLSGGRPHWVLSADAYGDVRRDVGRDPDAGHPSPAIPISQLSPRLRVIRPLDVALPFRRVATAERVCTTMGSHPETFVKQLNLGLQTHFTARRENSLRSYHNPVRATCDGL